MSFDFKKAIRNRLVDDATIRTELGVTTTGSAPVSPIFSERSGVYPQIIYEDSYGPSDPGLQSQNGRIDFHIQVSTSGGEDPHKQYEDIANRISGLFDDVAFSGSGVYNYLMIREGSPGVLYDQKLKIMTKIVGYSYKIT